MGKVARAGTWVLGQDYLGSHALDQFRTDLETKRGSKEPRLPDLRDWDHLHTHHATRRDVFLTWDKAILRLAEALLEHFSIRAMTPEQYLEATAR